MAMIIQRADLSELAAIAALVNSAYRGEAARKSWASEADLISGQRTQIETLRAELVGHDQRRILTMRETEDGPLIGCVMLDRTDPETCYLGMLSVTPDADNKGIGKRLMAASEDFARTTGAKRMRITVIQVRTALIAWYERQGFVLTGETQPFPYDDQRFGVPLRDDLHFVVLEKLL